MKHTLNKQEIIGELIHKSNLEKQTSLEDIPESALADVNLMRDAISRCGMVIKYGSPEIRDNKELALLAAESYTQSEQDPRSSSEIFCALSERLRGDDEVIQTFISCYDVEYEKTWEDDFYAFNATAAEVFKNISGDCRTPEYLASLYNRLDALMTEELIEYAFKDDEFLEDFMELVDIIDDNYCYYIYEVYSPEKAAEILRNLDEHPDAFDEAKLKYYIEKTTFLSKYGDLINYCPYTKEELVNSNENLLNDLIENGYIKTIDIREYTDDPQLIEHVKNAIASKEDPDLGEVLGYGQAVLNDNIIPDNSSEKSQDNNTRNVIANNTR
jgi:hypothetical protein